MTFKKISDSVAELYQPPTPTHHLESWTRFELVAPHYIDMTFCCRATQHVFDYDYIGLFWASYINAAEDKKPLLPWRHGAPRGQLEPVLRLIMMKAPCATATTTSP